MIDKEQVLKIADEPVAGKDTRSEALKPLRDLVLVGNLMAMKLGQEPTNLVNTWDELVERLRDSGLLEKLMMLELKQ